MVVWLILNPNRNGSSLHWVIWTILGRILFDTNCGDSQEQQQCVESASHGQWQISFSSQLWQLCFARRVSVNLLCIQHRSSGVLRWSSWPIFAMQTRSCDLSFSCSLSANWHRSKHSWSHSDQWASVSWVRGSRDRFECQLRHFPSANTTSKPDRQVKLISFSSSNAMEFSSYIAEESNCFSTKQHRQNVFDCSITDKRLGVRAERVWLPCWCGENAGGQAVWRHVSRQCFSRTEQHQFVGLGHNVQHNV